MNQSQSYNNLQGPNLQMLINEKQQSINYHYANRDRVGQGSAQLSKENKINQDSYSNSRVYQQNQNQQNLRTDLLQNYSFDSKTESLNKRLLSNLQSYHQMNYPATFKNNSYIPQFHQSLKPRLSEKNQYFQGAASEIMNVSMKPPKIPQTIHSNNLPYEEKYVGILGLGQGKEKKPNMYNYQSQQEIESPRSKKRRERIERQERERQEMKQLQGYDYFGRDSNNSQSLTIPRSRISSNQEQKRDININPRDQKIQRFQDQIENGFRYSNQQSPNKNESKIYQVVQQDQSVKAYREDSHVQKLLYNQDKNFQNVIPKRISTFAQNGEIYMTPEEQNEKLKQKQSYADELQRQIQEKKIKEQIQKKKIDEEDFEREKKIQLEIQKEKEIQQIKVKQAENQIGDGKVRFSPIINKRLSPQKEIQVKNEKQEDLFQQKPSPRIIQQNLMQQENPNASINQYQKSSQRQDFRSQRYFEDQVERLQREIDLQKLKFDQHQIEMRNLINIDIYNERSQRDKKELQEKMITQFHQKNPQFNQIDVDKSITAETVLVPVLREFQDIQRKINQKDGQGSFSQSNQRQENRLQNFSNPFYQNQ